MSSSMSDMAFSAVPAVSLAAVPAPLPAPVVAATPRYRTFTFGLGFLCGQASLIFIAVLFLRYVVFEDPKKALHEAGQRKKKRLRNKQRQRRASTAHRGAKSGSKFTATTSIPASDQLILSKLSYDLSTHAAESCDWLNVLVAQAVSAYRSMILDEAMNYSRNSGHETSDDEDTDGANGDKTGGGRGAKRYVEKALNSGRGEGEEKGGTGVVALDYITVTEFDFGQEYPVCSNARVRPSNESGKVRIEVDIDYSDHVSLAIETKVLINFPRPKFAVIPVNLALALVQFSATLTIEVPPPSFTPISGPDSASNAKASMSLSLHPDFILDLASTSLIGSRAKLQDIPKVEQLIIGRVRNYVIENFVWPKVRTFNLPRVGGKKSPNPTQVIPTVLTTDTLGEVQSDSSYKSRNLDGTDEPGSDSELRVRSPSTGSAMEDEEDEELDDDDIDDEEPDDEVFDGRLPLRVQTQVTPDGRGRRQPSRLATMPSSVKSGAVFSGIEPSTHASEAHRRLRRGSSLSSSTTASDLLASSRRTSASGSSTTPGGLTFSPPALTASTSSRSDAGSNFSPQDIRHRIPLHSPGLGIGLKPGPSKRHSIQAYLPNSGASSSGQYSPFPPISSAYSNHLSRTSSVTSLPTLLSPRAEQPSASKLADLLDAESPRWAAARKAADTRRTYETRSSAKKNKKMADSRPEDDNHASPTAKTRSRPS